jgi:hypothetical protein
MLPPAILFADHAGIVAVEDRSEVRLRTSIPAGTGSTGVDLYTAPKLDATLTYPRWQFLLTAMPSATLQDLEQGIDSQTAQLYAMGHLSAAWHDRFVVVTASEDGSYGTFNATNLQSVNAPLTAGSTAMPTGGQNLLTVAKNETITTASSRSALMVSDRPSRRATYMLDASYSLSGGVTDSARAILPFQYGPRVDGTLSYVVSRRDLMVTTAYAFSTDFTTGPCAGFTVVMGATVPTCAPQIRLAYLTEGVRHAIDGATVLSVSAGAAAAAFRIDTDVDYEPFVAPVATASLSHRLRRLGQNSWEIDVSLTPTVDPTTGSLSDFVSGQFTYMSALSSRLTLQASAGAGQSLYVKGPTSITSVQGNLEADYLLNPQAYPQLLLGLGERLGFVDSSPTHQPLPSNAIPETGSFFSAFTYFAVTVRAPVERF